MEKSMNPIGFAILTVSDTCHKDKNQDKSGPAIEQFLQNELCDIKKLSCAKIFLTAIVPDEKAFIIDKLMTWSNDKNIDVILTTGGTGFSKRDVTPEATKEVIEKEAPGIAIAMLISSLKSTPMAMLSRAVCGIRNNTLIINLPGSPRGAKECLSAIAPVISHAVDLIKDNKDKINDTHRYGTVKSSIPQFPSSKSEKLCLRSIVDRNRKSPFPMISVEEALQLIHKEAEPLNSKKKVDLEMCHGRILHDNLYSECDIPPYRASIKDGYAVLASDGKGKRNLLTTHSVLKAGNSVPNVRLEPGECIRVNTGGPIPDNATAVVQVEDTKLIKTTADHAEESEIEIMTEPIFGQDLRPIGCDGKKGDLILSLGTKLGAVELGLAAACGHKQLPVTDLPKVAVLSTGDELQCPGTPLMPGHIYDSNKIMLLMMLKENGFEGADLGIAPDNMNMLISKIQEAIKCSDVVITSGSVSIGETDMLKPILEFVFGATIHFGRVNMKPGKPCTFATCWFDNKKKYFLCLPGNPVSATVTMSLFVLPLLNKLCKSEYTPVIVKAKSTSFYNLDSRPEYARVILKWKETDLLPLAYSTGNQISSRLMSCKNANALLMLPARTEEKTLVQMGDIVQAMLLGLMK